MALLFRARTSWGRKGFKAALYGLIFGLLGTLVAVVGCKRGVTTLEREPIRVGILLSLTGAFSPQEIGAVDAMLLAIQEINENGGLLGRTVVPIIANGNSDSETFVKEISRLLIQERVPVVFGGGTSSSRK